MALDSKQALAVKLLTEISGTPKKNGAAQFFGAKEFDRALKTNPADFWERESRKKALHLFRETAEHVPAYKKFLREHGVDSKRIRIFADWQNIPLLTKQNYIEKYPLAERLFGGRVDDGGKIIAGSSGTTGEPKYWPRGPLQERESAVIHEMLLRSVGDIERRSTLVIDCFPVGIYVSGIATLLPLWAVAEKGYNLSVAAVGNNKSEALRALTSLARSFEQVIIFGHPFFVKDLVESARQKKFVFPAHTKLILCSQGFNEAWRTYVEKLVGVKERPVIINTYGSSELLLIGHETEFSIAASKIISEDKNLRGKIFSVELPLWNLYQYNPLMRFVEEVNGELVFSANAGVPLIRYQLKDKGRIIPYDTLSEQLPNGKNLKKQVAESWKLPFLALGGRSDQTIIYYAANIYPEHLQAILHHGGLFKMLTGKFTMQKITDKKKEERLLINIELRAGVLQSAQLRKKIGKILAEKLEHVNAEYADAKLHAGRDITPAVILWPYQSEPYFKPGLKPRFIMR